MLNLQVAMLSNGDQILGEFINFNDSYLVKQAIIIKEVVLPGGVGSVSTIFPTKDDDITVNKNHICIKPSTPTDKLVAMHTKMFSSLVLPKAV